MRPPLKNHRRESTSRKTNIIFSGIPSGCRSRGLSFHWQVAARQPNLRWNGECFLRF